MITPAFVRAMAGYNAHLNREVYAAARLDEAARRGNEWGTPICGWWFDRHLSPVMAGLDPATHGATPPLTKRGWRDLPSR